MKINPNEIKIWQQATEVLENLLDLPVDDALEKLGQMSGLDEKIKQAVIQLLKATSQDSQILIDQVSNSINDHSNSQQICQIGDIFGDYKLEKLIGQGGMSCIYMAKHINADIQKPVAIKVFLHANTSEKLLQHFINEQMILASLNHENIVSLHHGGTSSTGVPYLVMDYLHDAQLIDEYCQKNALSVQQIMALCAQVADALAYAHGQLIVHRDLKPGNILIDQNRMPKVVDFGIARLLSEEEGCNNNTLFALTPSYASPEQINGQEISVRSDVFSMSAVILNLISNKEPLPVDRMFKACRSDSAYIRTLLGKLSIDQDLKNIINKGLQNDPKRRYSTMAELASDIGRWRDQRPVHATPDSVLYRTRKFIMRRTALFASLLTLVFSLVFGIMALLYQSDKTRLEAEKANQVKNFMLDVFAVTHPDQAQGEVVTALNLLDTAQAELESERHDSLELKAELMTATGIAYGQLGAWAKSIDILSKSLKIDSTNEETIINLAKFQINSGDEEGARKTLLDHRVLLNKILNNSRKSSYLRIQAKMAANNSEFEQSQGFIDQALKIDTENQDTLSIISDQRLQAEHLFFQSKSAEAITLLEAVLGKYQAKLSPTNTLIMGIMSDLGNLYNDVGAYDKSLKLLIKLIENQKNILGENHAELVVSLVQLSGAYRATGKIDKAIELAQQALALSKKLFGENHPQSGKALNMLGVLSYVTGDTPQAIAYLQEVISIYEKSYGPHYADAWDIKTNLATVMGMYGRNEEAFTLIDSVTKAQTETLGSNHRSTIYSLQVSIRILTALHRYTEAIEIGEKMLPITLEELGEDHPLSIGMFFSLGKAYMEAGESQKGLDIMLLVESKGILDPDNERYMVFAGNISDLYLALSNNEKAQQYAEKSYESALKNLGEDNIKSIKYLLKLANTKKQNNSPEKSKNHYLKAKTLLENHSGEIKQKMLETIKEALSES